MDALKQLEDTLNHVVIGKQQQIRLALVCLLARGHLLLEDLPGAGKTTLAKAIAKLIDLDTKRIQFTADMLPSDITGALIYQPATQQFKLQKGPIFTHVLLADEINRASPKCQSALLEAMEEKQVSIEGNTLELASPFFVIATQNPSEQYGTYPLPESQLDRFLFKISLGYMDTESEIAVLAGQDRNDMIEKLTPIIDHNKLLQYQSAISQIEVSPAIAKYIQALLDASRKTDIFLHGLSTRSGMAMVRAAQAYAMMHSEKSVYPEHVQAVFPYIAGHRLTPKGANNQTVQSAYLSELLESVSLAL